METDPGHVGSHEHNAAGTRICRAGSVRKRLARAGLLLAAIVVVAYVFRPVASARRPLDRSARRLDAIRRARVWVPGDVRSKDLRRGPQGPGAFLPDQLVECDYVDDRFEGKSPKFECALSPDDRVKVKYGAGNGEVYAEVAATRLLWALGFGADRVYPVRIRCRGCPQDFRGTPDPSRIELVDPATVERKFDGRPLEGDEGAGWTWPELDLVDEAAGGAPRAHIDALRLLAAVLQHTDSKAVNQRLVVVPDGQPFLLINDLGLTFGRANILNRNSVGSADLDDWVHTPVWAMGPGCVANIERSYTGTLDHPRIGEAGRAMLSRLLDQLSREQIEEMFDVSRIAERSHRSVTDWVDAFDRKRAEIRDRRCANPA